VNGAFYIGAIGLDAQQKALDVVANNIANINTAGFKGSAVQFSDLVAPVHNESDLPVVLGDRAAILSGTTVVGTPHIWTEGPLQKTGQPLDLAIAGSGFIELLGPSGQTMLWRGGSLTVNQDGYLAATDGTPLQAMISVPQGASALTIAADGTVTATVGGAQESQRLGQIEMVMVKDTNGLVDADNSYYEASDATNIYTVQAGEEGSGTFVQGSLESSNVQLNEAMVELLLYQRAYAANAQVVQAGDQLMSIVNGLRR